VKSDRRTYRRPREPVNKRGFAWKPSEGRSDFLSNLRKVTEKPPTGFSESDVGRPPGVECDVGRTLDELVSSKLETTRLTDDEVCDGSCLAMESIWFQLCQN
jgi:hypothetical protein